MEIKTIEHEIAPIYNDRSRILILGSLPSVKSREVNFYYGHPQNRFWRIIAAITNSPLPVTTDDKKALLLDNSIALWDVIARCDIAGSSDSSIKNVTPTDIQTVLEAANIKAVFTNGGTATRIYRKYQFPATGIEPIPLPSTSPANAAWSFDKLTAEWERQIKPFLA